MANASIRTIKVLCGTLIACAWVGISVAPVDAVPIARGLSVFTAMYELAKPLNGGHAFCTQYVSECVDKTTIPHRITLTPENLEIIVGANDWVNHRIKPMTDGKQWDTVNEWVNLNDGYDSCKAYALLKREILTGIGFPRDALLIRIVWTKENYGHAVLIVRTHEGDFVLDDLSPKVALWTLTTHGYVDRQSPTDSNGWVYINSYLQK
jgi:predicted transglutaminase-like cysteine proteinase